MTAPKTAAMPGKQKRRWVRWTLLSALVGLLVIVSIPFLFTAAIVRVILARTPYAAFHPTFQSASLSLSGQLVIAGLTLRDISVPGDQTLLSVEKVTVRFHWLDLLTPHLESVDAEGVVAHERPGSDIPITLMRLANPAPSAPAAASAKRSDFRLDLLHLNGTIEAAPLNGLTLPSQTWTVDGTFTTTGPDAAPLLTIDAVLKPAPAKTADPMQLSTSIDFHLENSHDALVMGASTTNIRIDADDALLRTIAPSASVLGGHATLAVASLNAAITMPHNGGLSTYQYTIRDLSASNAQSAPAPIRVTGVLAKGDGELHPGDWGASSLAVHSAAVADAVVGPVHLQAIQIAGSFHDHGVVLDNASFDFGGGHIRANGTYDLATRIIANASVSLTNIQPGKALAPYIIVPPGLDTRVTATATVAKLAPVSMDRGWSAGVWVDKATAIGSLVLPPLADLELPTQNLNFVADAQSTGTETAPLDTLNLTLTAPPGPSGSPARISAKLERNAAALALDVMATNISAIAPGALLQRYGLPHDTASDGASASFGALHATASFPTNANAAAFTYELTDASVQTPDAAKSPVHLMHINAAGGGTLSVSDPSASDAAFTLDRFSMGPSIIGPQTIQSLQLAGTLRDHVATISQLTAEFPGGYAKAHAAFDLRSNTASNVGLDLTNLQVSQAAAPYIKQKLPIDARITLSLTARQASLAGPAADWASALRVAGAKATGSVSLSPLDGLVLPSQVWSFAADADLSGDGKSFAQKLNATFTAGAPGAPVSANPAQVVLNAQRDGTSTTAKATISNVAAAASAAFFKAHAPNAAPLQDGISANLGTAQVSVTLTPQAAGTAMDYWYEITDASALTPQGAASPMHFQHVTAGGNGQRPAGAATLYDGFFAVSHFAMQDALVGKQALHATELAGGVKDNVAYLQWLNTDFAGGRATGYAQYDLKNQLLTGAGVDLAKIQIHVSLDKLAPQYVDAEGLFDGNVSLKQANSGDPVEGTVTLTSKGSGVLKLHDVPGLKEALPAAQSNKFTQAALLEFSHYPYLDGTAVLTADGPHNTKVAAQFNRDMTAPAVEIPGGMDVDGHTFAAETRVPKLPISGSVNKSLPEIIELVTMSWLAQLNDSRSHGPGM